MVSSVDPDQTAPLGAVPACPKTMDHYGILYYKYCGLENSVW